MRNKKRIYGAACLPVSIIWGLCLLPLAARAQVISEIFYSPQSKSWVEIYNSSASSIDLTKYKILDSSVTTGHAVSYSSGPALLAPGAYAVIAKDPTQLQGVSSAFYKSALAAKTSGDTFSLKDPSGNVVDSFAFTSSMGAFGDGNSLQRQADGSWIATAPTPGVINASTPPAASEEAADDASSTSQEASTAAPVSIPALSAHYSFIPAQNDTSMTFTVRAGRDRLAVTYEPVEFKAVLNTNDPNTSYFWNFGDGTTGEGKDIAHEYALAGDYTVVLDAVLFDHEAISRTSVKIVDPELGIAEARPEYVAVKNSSAYEANLYGWKLVSDRAEFAFPKDTLITAGQTIRFPSSATKISGGATVSLIQISASSTQSLLPTISAVPVAIASTTPRNVRDIQALADKLVLLNQKLYAVRAPQTLPSTSTSTSVPKILEASVDEALPASASSSWMHTLKAFFGFN